MGSDVTSSMGSALLWGGAKPWADRSNGVAMWDMGPLDMGPSAVGSSVSGSQIRGRSRRSGAAVGPQRSNRAKAPHRRCPIAAMNPGPNGIKALLLLVVWSP